MRTPTLLIAMLTTTLLAAGGDAPRFTPEQLALPGKKGACFTMRDPARSDQGRWDTNLKKIEALNPAWNYTWGTALVPVQPAGVEFVPMVWSARDKASLQRHLDERVKPLVKDGRIKRLMAFNEPDNKKQANMTVQEALSYWPALEALNVPLVSPGCANPEGVDDESVQDVPGTWMRDFIREADQRGYRVDYIAVHWYGGTSAEAFKNKLRRIHEKYGKRPLLITEFAPADWKTEGDIARHRQTPAKVLAFMKEVLPWIEQQDWIAGYAWFSFSADSPQGTSSALFHADGSLTACGRFYRSVTAENPNGDQTIEPDPTHHAPPPGE